MPVDLQLLRLLNRPGPRALDLLMIAASNGAVLLTVAFAVALYLAFRSPHRWVAAILLLLSVAVADLVSVRVVKPLFARPRPCHTFVDVRAPVGCGSGKSMPSTHAADTAAAATVIAWAAPALSPIALALAALVGVSRVYLGVHYPSDVVAGWVLGVVVGAALIALARLRFAVSAR